MSPTGIRVFALAVCLGPAVSPLQTTRAEADAEPLLQQLQANFKQPYLSFGVLFQSVADFQIDRTTAGQNGFSVANFRLALYGDLDAGFGYFLQANFTGTPAILDARLKYRPSRYAAFDFGQFKVPFSKEFLTGAGAIDFVNRSQVVTALAPGRQIGIDAAFANEAGTWRLTTGAFNGNGARANGNDDDGFLVAARASSHHVVSPGGSTPARIEAGINVAYSDDAAAAFGNGFASNFSGERSLVGADFRLTAGEWLAAGEVIYARLEPRTAPRREPGGFYLTGGYMVRDDLQVLLRWDRFQPRGGAADRDLAIAGVNVWPTKATEFQFNYLVDPDRSGIDEHQLLINVQLGF